MAYCTQGDLEKAKPKIELIQLTNDEGGEEVDDDNLNNAISRADKVIDAHIGGRYALPLSTTPELIGDIAVDLTIYFLWTRKQEVSEQVQSSHDQAMKLLREIREGKLFLPELENLQTPKGDVRINKSSEDRIFSKDLLSQL